MGSSSSNRSPYFLVGNKLGYILVSNVNLMAKKTPLPGYRLSSGLKNKHIVFLTGPFGHIVQKKLRDVLQERESTSLNYFKEFFSYIKQFSWSIFLNLYLSQSILDYLVLSRCILVYLRLSQSNLCPSW